MTQIARATQDHEALSRLRGELEEVDRTLVEALGKRYQLALEVGRAKRAAGIPIFDPAQEAAVLRRAVIMARASGIEEEEVRNIFWSIIALARVAQRGDD